MIAKLFSHDEPADEAKKEPTEGEPETESQAPEGQPEPAVTLETFSKRNAWRINGEGERVSAIPLMAGFVHQMRAEGRHAAPASTYQTYWDKFGEAKKN